MSASAKQLQLIPESAYKAALLKALDIVPEPSWFSTKFDCGDNTTLEITESGVVYHREGVSSLISINDVTKNVRAAPSTPTGDALRVYLRRWGWLPKPERDALAAQANTRMIT